jgi:hypothetical protein
VNLPVRLGFFAGEARRLQQRHQAHRYRWAVRSPWGYGALEFLVALPVLLLFALVVLQWIWVLHERSVVEHALQEAVRSGATGHASPASIEAGLARGLEPMWALGPSQADRQTRRQTSLLALRQARSEGWLILRVLSPTAASFDDWAVQALDESGRPIPDVLEIPNDNLSWRQRYQHPKSGTSSLSGAAPVGVASGQSLLDANLIKLEAHMGLALRVPLAGPLMSWVSRLAHGCASPGAAAGPRCSVVLADSGKAPRLPIHLSATTRMQSPARSTVGSFLASSDSGGFSTGTTVPSDQRSPVSKPAVSDADASREVASTQGNPDNSSIEGMNQPIEEQVQPDNQSIEIVAAGACLLGCSASTQDAGSCPK